VLCQLQHPPLAFTDPGLDLVVGNELPCSACEANGAMTTAGREQRLPHISVCFARENPAERI